MTWLLADLIITRDVCEPVCAVCVQYSVCLWCARADGFRDAELHNVDHRAPNCSRTVITVPQPRWSHWRKANCAQVKNVITLFNYFNRVAYSTLRLNNCPLTQMVLQQWQFFKNICIISGTSLGVRRTNTMYFYIVSCSFFMYFLYQHVPCCSCSCSNDPFPSL